MRDFDITTFRDHPPRLKKKKKQNVKRGTKRAAKNSFIDYLEKSLDSDSDKSSSEDIDDRPKKKSTKARVALSTLPELKENGVNTIERDLQTPEGSRQIVVAQNHVQSAPEEEQEEEEEEEDIMLFSDEGTPTQTIVQSPPRPKQQSSPPPPSKKSPKKIEVYPDYSVDLDELDPELARIAMGDACLDYDNNDRDQKKEESSRQPQKICIKVQYINMESSTNSSAQNLIQMLQKPARFVIMENDTFSILFQHFCKRKCLKQEDLILIHKNVHVLLFTTPASLGMTPDGDNTLEVYTKTGYEEKQKQDKEKMLESIKKAGPMLNEDFFNGCQSESDQAAENEPKIIFTLRDKKGVDISLRARQTTQIKAIIHQYCHVRGFGPEIEAKIRLSFDDETLDPNTMVKDHELEDDDMLSVQM